MRLIQLHSGPGRLCSRPGMPALTRGRGITGKQCRTAPGPLPEKPRLTHCCLPWKRLRAVLLRRQGRRPLRSPLLLSSAGLMFYPDRLTLKAILCQWSRGCRADWSIPSRSLPSKMMLHRRFSGDSLPFSGGRGRGARHCIILRGCSAGLMMPGGLFQKQGEPVSPMPSS